MNETENNLFKNDSDDHNSYLNDLNLCDEFSNDDFLAFGDE